MAFIAPVNTPRGVDADIKVEAIRDIKGSLTMVRKVWKELLVNGRSMTVREAMWVSIISKGFEDVYASDALDEIVSSALHYAKEESAYELLSQTKDMGAFETNDYDAAKGANYGYIALKTVWVLHVAELLIAPTVKGHNPCHLAIGDFITCRYQAIGTERFPSYSAHSG